MQQPVVTPDRQYTEAERRVIEWFVSGNAGRPLIMNSREPYKIGQKVPGPHPIAAPWGETVNVDNPVVVIREVSFEEWKANLPEGSPGKRYAICPPNCWFWEVATD